MTAKALHNKESGLQKYGCIKNAKGADSNRARLEVVASEAIQEGIENPVDMRLCDHIDHMQKYEELYDYRNEKALDDLGFVDPMADVKWTTNTEPDWGFKEYMKLNAKGKREYLVGDFDVDSDTDGITNDKGIRRAGVKRYSLLFDSNKRKNIYIKSYATMEAIDGAIRTRSRHSVFVCFVVIDNTDGGSSRISPTLS